MDFVPFHHRFSSPWTCSSLWNSIYYDRCQNDRKQLPFADLIRKNISPHDVLKWSSSIEMADQYAHAFSMNFTHHDHYLCNWWKTIWSRASIGFTVGAKGGGTLFLTFSGTINTNSFFYEMKIAEFKMRLWVEKAYKML